MLYDRKVRSRLEAMLRGSLNDQTAIVREMQGEGFTAINLVGGEKYDDGHGTPWDLHRISVGTDERYYWIGMKVVFVGGKGVQDLSSVSFVLALGSPGMQKTLVRAEYDQKARPHAQPHWHVYPDIDPYRQWLAEASAGYAQRIHWAMCARWPERGAIAEAVYHRFVSVDDLEAWCSGCVMYVIEQLQYLEKKLPAVRNFFDTEGAGV